MADNGATATWSGYNHQGKVGLFVALRKMSTFVVPGTPINGSVFGDWYVEFEGAEDFEICSQPPSSDPSYLDSRHQVKAYAGQGGRFFSDYKEVVEPYVNSSGTQMPGFNKIIKDENGNGITEAELAADKRLIHLIQDVPSWKSDVQSNLNQVSRYEYPSYANQPAKFYCELSNSSETQDLDLPLDKIAYEFIGLLTNKDPAAIKLIWISLQVDLQIKIAKCHDEGGRPRVKFKEIFEDFIDQNNLLQTYIDNYKADALRRSLLNKWQDVQQRYEDGSGLDDGARARINSWISGVYKKDNFSLKEFVDNFSPDAFPPHDDIQMAGFHAVICDVIKQVQLNPSSGSYHYKKSELPYYLTTISDDLEQVSNANLVGKINRYINESSDNRYKRPSVIITKHHDLELDDPVFAEGLKYGSSSESTQTMTIGDVEIPNVESYQPRRIITSAKAVEELNKEV